MTEIARSVASVSGALLLLGVSLIVGVALYRAWRDARQTKVVISTVVDATGDDTTKNRVLGITHRLREELLAALPRLAERVTEEIDKAKSDATSPIRALVVEDIARNRLVDDIDSSKQQLTDSIASLVPESARSALRILTETLLRPRGVRVSVVLQRVKDAAGGVGISFSVSPLQAEEATSRVTLWEDDGTNVSGKEVPERLSDLVVPASRSLACELLRHSLMAAKARPRLRDRLGRDRPEERHPREAVIDYVIGTLYQTAAGRYAPATMTFYRQAELALRRAERELDHYAVPYALAMVLIDQGKRETRDEVAVELFEGTIPLLERAREKLPDAHLVGQAWKAADLKIRAALASTYCLMAERMDAPSRAAERAARAIAELQDADTDTLALEDPTALYNLACALAVASRLEALPEHGVDLEHCMAGAKQHLLYACLREDRWWIDGKADPDLDPLRSWMLDAHRQILATWRDERLEPGAFGAIVTQVLTATAQGRQPSERTRVGSEM